MQCAKCSAELIGAKKFCVACGAPAEPLRARAQGGVDPFASTSPPGSVQAVSLPAPQNVVLESAQPSGRVVSPLATSASDFPDEARRVIAAIEPVESRVAHTAQGTAIMAARSVPPAPGSHPSVAAATPASRQPHATGAPAHGSASRPPTPAAPPASGTRVSVRWSDGRSYPGTVWQAHGSRLLVAFPDGQQHWVEAVYVDRL